MENCAVIQGDEVREESSAPIRKLRMKRKRVMKRKDLKSGRLPLQDPSSDETCKQESNTKPHFHTIFKCLNASLLTIVGVKYQAISQDPFKTLAQNTWSFLIAFFIYSLIIFAMKQSRNPCNIKLQIILGASGVVSSVSLLSLLIPRFYGRIVLYISWALFVVVSALPLALLQWAYNGLLIGITTMIDFAKNLFNGSNSSQQQLPPQETRTQQPPSQETIPPV